MANRKPAPQLSGTWFILIILLALSSLLLAACSASGIPSNKPPEGGDLYRPPALSTPIASPTPLPSSTPIPQLSAAPTQPPAPACENGLRYIEDLSIPDGSIAASGESLDKRWRVENNGTCNWDERYRLKLIAGPDLGAGQARALYPARGGSQADLQIIFTAPQEPGAYRSAWQAHDPAGQPFGDPIFIDFIVLAP
jgi:hypothetical protein